MKVLNLSIECKTTAKGTEYRGTISKTRSGYVCQRWTSQSPHRHGFTPERKPGKGLESNFCRNPDKEPRPWCYTTSPRKRWDFCSIPDCPGMNLLASQSPQRHSLKLARRLGKGLESSFCGNPDKEPRPRYYTILPRKRGGEYCSTPDCPAVKSAFSDLFQFSVTGDPK